jgi:hypothetical protein
VKNTYEWKDFKIQRFFQKEGEYYDNNLFRYKKTLYGFKQPDEEYLIYSKSVVKTFYDRDGVSE